MFSLNPAIKLCLSPLLSILVCISTYKYNTFHAQISFIISALVGHICPLGFPCDSSDPSDRLAASICSTSLSLSSGVWLFWSALILNLEMNSVLASAPSFLGHVRFDNRRCSKRSTKKTLTTKCYLCDVHWYIWFLGQGCKSRFRSHLFVNWISQKHVDTFQSNK